jgi:hypothetical protein
VLLFASFENPVFELGGVVPPGVVPLPPLLLPPQAVATVAQIASPATAVSPRLCVCIDTLLIAEDALRFVVAIRQRAQCAISGPTSEINLRLLSTGENARIQRVDKS